MKIKYVLITSAYNEEKNIDKTLESVTEQTILPQRWVIVSEGSSEGSTDRIEKIIDEFAQKFDFIELLRLPKTYKKRDPGLKVHALNAGLAHLKNIEYSFLANLDADVSFASNYFEFLLEQFHKNSQLAIAGGVIYDIYNGQCVRQIARLDSVGGPLQMFRRELFEQMNGYLLIEGGGGEDAVAEYMARRYGWEVKAFPEMRIMHWRRPGTAEGQSIFKHRFQQGVRDYKIGYHPLFEMAKCVRRVVEKPFIIGSVLWFSGYLWATITSCRRSVPKDILEYIQKEQLELLLRPTKYRQLTRLEEKKG